MPVFADAQGELISGHARVSAATNCAGDIDPSDRGAGLVFGVLTNGTKHSIMLRLNREFAMPSKAGPFTFAELQMVTSLGRGEIRECINREIISARAGVGQGRHRAYSKWNLVEGVIAAALLRHVRAGSVAGVMLRLRWLLGAYQIDPDAYCWAPDRFEFEVYFPPRTKPDGKADLALGEDAGEGAFLIATASKAKQSNDGPSLTSDTPSDPFCRIPIDLEKAVLFVNSMIETKL